MPQALRPLETEIGIISGRDAIYLDKLTSQNGWVTLEGRINGRLASERINDWIDYSITFFGVLALSILELDSWHGEQATSFFEVVDSPLLAQLGGKVTPEHRHIVFVTYDDVIEVICERFELNLKTD